MRAVGRFPHPLRSSAEPLCSIAGMQSSGWNFLAAVLFLGVGIYILLTGQTDWWSIVTIVVALSGSLVYFVRGFRARRRLKTPSRGDSGQSGP